MGKTQYEHREEYTMLPLPDELFAEFPATTEHNGEVLYKKSSFHVSLMCTKGMSDTKSEDATSFFKKFVSSAPILFDSFIDEFRFVEKDKRKAIVLLCKMRNLRKFFSTMNEVLGVDMPTQPAHVTLYTLQKDAGIGITSYKEMDLAQVIQKPDLSKLLVESKL